MMGFFWLSLASLLSLLFPLQQQPQQFCNCPQLPGLLNGVCFDRAPDDSAPPFSISGRPTSAVLQPDRATIPPLPPNVTDTILSCLYRIRQTIIYGRTRSTVQRSISYTKDIYLQMYPHYENHFLCMNFKN